MICQNCGFNDGKKMSTTQQRKAYFGIAVKTLADHYSQRKEIMHKALAGAFFGFVNVDMGNGFVMRVPETTTGRTTKEMKEFFEYIQHIAADRGINVPSPDPCPRDNP